MSQDTTNAVTGFLASEITDGSLTSSTLSRSAQPQALAAYSSLASMVPTRVLNGVDLGGLTLTPGVYAFSSSAQLTGTPVLNAEGETDAQFVLQIGSTLTTAIRSVVAVINAEPSTSIYWQVGRSATLGDSSVFLGNILANTSISLSASAEITGGRWRVWEPPVER